MSYLNRANSGQLDLDAHALGGTILSIADGAAAGRWLFGDLLHSPRRKAQT